MKICSYHQEKGVQVLTRILNSKKATKEKKLLAMIGLVNMARKENRKWAI